MTEDVRLIALGPGAAAVGAAPALYVRAYLARHRLGRKRAFLGLPEHAESLLVVDRGAAVGARLRVGVDAYAGQQRVHVRGHAPVQGRGLTAGQEARPVFLFCGQRAITNQAATRWPATTSASPASTATPPSCCS
ncbi:hypothetical protein GCM10018785_15850 [Streptomyces longispororuber]|uniref:Uncharacterized protein n=1 Tax=Streptomyces longispororuber TaxID=68230 RepID=A0A918ZDI7_9ACTN|nr:hypothetical protein [Streptomyces longispororuber]GHE47028.1 hypothetical protein GCM10018785_15850 [Streptomyces longispororuber]